MTGCKVELRISHQSYAAKTFPRPTAPAEPEIEAPPLKVHIRDMSTQTESDEPTVSVTVSPTKRVHVTGATPSTSKEKKTTLRNKCRICLQDFTSDGRLWVGCCHLSKRGLKTCPMWVHQKCIWLKYPTNAELSQVKVYCPDHQDDAWRLSTS